MSQSLLTRCWNSSVRVLGIRTAAPQRGQQFAVRTHQIGGVAGVEHRIAPRMHLPPAARADLRLHFVKHIREVLEIVLLPAPEEQAAAE